MTIRVVANYAVENANTTGRRVLDSLSYLIEGDLLGAYLAQDNRRAAGDRRQDVDAVAILNCVRSVDEIAVDRQAHALEEGRQGGEPIDDRSAEIALGYALGLEIERRAFAAGKLSGGSIVVDLDPHRAREA